MPAAAMPVIPATPSRTRLACSAALTLPVVWRHPHASSDQVAAFQARRLQRIVAHAYRSVPYYRALFDQRGVTPRDVRSLGDLSRLPISRREDLQHQPPDRITAAGFTPASLIQHSTSGSSGRPLTIRRTWTEERPRACPRAARGRCGPGPSWPPGKCSLIQERSGGIVLQIVPATQPAETRLAELGARIGAIVGPDVSVRIEMVPSIPLDPSGKFRVSRSLVQSEYDDVAWDRA